MVTSKLMGLSPIFLSTIVASRNDPKRKNSSTFPAADCETGKEALVLRLDKWLKLTAVRFHIVYT